MTLESCVRRLVVVALAVGTPVLMAQTQPAGGKFGPLAPVLVDTHGDGPTADDMEIVPLRKGTGVQIPNPWDDCAGENNHNNTFFLGNQDKGGRYTSVQGARTTGGSAGAGITNSDGARALAFSLNFKTGPDSPTLEGVGTLMDQNKDGIYEGFHTEQVFNEARRGRSVLGTSLSMDLTFVFADGNNDGKKDHISIPWAQASALGLRRFPESCQISQPSDPQIWIPLADTNDDGTPDGIVPDLDGNGVADPDLFMSPPLTGPVAVPCTYALDPTSRIVPAAGGSYNFAVNTQAGCTWTAVSNNSFITGVTPSGTGTGTVSYSVAANLAGGRSGTITAAGQTHTVTQDAFVPPAIPIPTVSEWGLLAFAAALGIAGWLRLRQGGLGL